MILLEYGEEGKMKDYNIDKVLEEIYKIDAEGVLLNDKLKTVEHEFYLKLLEHLKDLERQYMKSARIEAKKKTKEILLETIEEEQKIMEQCYKETDKLDDILKHHQEELIKKVFNYVFLEN